MISTAHSSSLVSEVTECSVFYWLVYTICWTAAPSQLSHIKYSPCSLVQKSCSTVWTHILSFHPTHHLYTSHSPSVSSLLASWVRHSFIYLIIFWLLSVLTVEKPSSQPHSGNIWQEKLTSEISNVPLKNHQLLRKVITLIFECMGSTLHKSSWVSGNSMDTKRNSEAIKGVLGSFWQIGPKTHSHYYLESEVIKQRHFC